MALQQLAANQANPEVIINENFEGLDHVGVFGKAHATSTGLTWGYNGGRWGGTEIMAGTVTLTNAATNYVVVLRSTGAVSVSTATTNADLTIAAARGFASAVALWPFGFGTVLVTDIVLTQTTPIGITGALAVSGDVDTGGDVFELVAPLDITPVAAALTVAGDISTTSALSMATSVPVPMAMPTSAAASAGASLTPSPVMATICPLFWSARTIWSLFSGETRA